MAAKAKTHQFKAETKKVLNILTHSLYTNREIFLRELLSNASDALEKVRFLQNKGEVLRDPDLPLEIRITVNKDQGWLEVADTGLGMSEEEMIANLGTIAKSGSEQFLKDIGQDVEAGGEVIVEDGQESEEAGPSSASQIIGKFGIGFYSVFMVADRVEVTSLSAGSDSTPHVWTSEGTGSFSIKELEGEDAEGIKRGTKVRAYLKDDAKEFLEKYRLEMIIRNHSNFLPFPIYLEGDLVNTTAAIWREPKFSITDEQYNDFYQYLTHDQKAPLDRLHLSVDAPVQFSALIYIPDSQQNLFNESREEYGLDLYVRRVLIQKDNHDLIPNYLGFLKGVVDTEDLPLNISRETLQENIVLRKISQTVVKQVFSHLERLAETDREKYNQFWKLHGRYFKLAVTDYTNQAKAAPLLRFASSAGSSDDLTSFDDYISRAKVDQKTIWYVAAPTPEAARVNPHLDRFRRKGIEVLYLLDAMDEFALESLGEYKDFKFKSAEQAEGKDLDAFPDVEAGKPEAPKMSLKDLNDFDKLIEKMKSILADRVLDIKVSDRLSGSPAVLVSPDGLSSSMDRIMRVMSKDESAPKKVLEVNPDHALLRSLLRVFKDNPEDPFLSDVSLNLLDNLMLMDGYLNEPYTMADRNLKLMGEAAEWYADLRKLD